MRDYGTLIMPDIPDFVSPIDGRVIHGRRGLREHNKEHNVTNMADFTETWKKAAEDRAKFFSGDPTYDSKRRIEHIKRAWEKERNKRR